MAIKPRRSKLPGLQVPSNLGAELRLFLESLKERVEASSGDRGDPKLRNVTLADLETAGLGKVIVQNGYGTLRSDLSSDVEAAASGTNSSATDPSTYFEVNPDDLGDQHYVIVYDSQAQAYRRLTYEQFADQFVRKWIDDEAYGTLTLVAPDSSIDPYPTRLKFEDDNGAANERLWDLHADLAKFSLRQLSDLDDTAVPVFEATRTGTAATTFDVKTTDLHHNGVKVIETASNLGAGATVFKAKVGYDLSFRTLVAGSNLSVTEGVDTITIAVANGDYGDITVNNGAWTIDNGAVSYAKIQNVSATDRLLGRASAGPGIIEEIPLTAAGRALIDDADAAAQRTTLGLGDAATKNVGTTAGTVAAGDHLHTGVYDPAGTAAAAVAAHEAALDPHPGYLTPAEANAAYALLGHTHLWADITDKPTTFTPSAHTHSLADLTGFGLAGGYIRSDGTAWVRVSGVAWGDLTGVPATFPPSAHSHAISDVTGLQTALDGKSAVGHTHTAANVTDFAEAVDDRVAALLVAGANVTLTYDDVLNTLTIASTGSGGVTDHGALTGLADDDHTQYHTDARGDARYSQLGHTHSYLPLSGGTVDGGLAVRVGGQAFSLYAGDTIDHVYMGFYADSQNQAFRSAYLGFGSAGSAHFEIVNAVSGGHFLFYTAGGGELRLNGTAVSLAGHAHSASDITSGILSIERIPRPGTGAWWGAIPQIAGDGVMEVGKYIDFHTTADASDGSGDFAVRLTAGIDALACSGNFSAYTLTTVGHITNGVITLRSDAIEQHTYDSDDGAVVVNFQGYNQGYTRYRDFTIYDGRGNIFSRFDGSAKTQYIYGDLRVSGSNGALWFENREGTGGDWAWYSQTNSYARLYRAGVGDVFIVASDGTAYAAVYVENGQTIASKYLQKNGNDTIGSNTFLAASLVETDNRTWSGLNINTLYGVAAGAGSSVLGDGFYTDALAFNQPTSATYTTDGTNWTSFTPGLSTFDGKTAQGWSGGISMAPGWQKVRLQWNGMGYRFFDHLIAGTSTNGNNVRFTIEASADGTNWTVLRGPSAWFSTWPGYATWNISSNNSGLSPYVRLTIERDQQNANYVDIGKLRLNCAYGGVTRLFDWDSSRNITFSGTINGTHGIFANSVRSDYFYSTTGDKLALQLNDSWLRLNQSGSFTSGVYTPGLFRADGGIGAGPDGSRHGLNPDGTSIQRYYTDNTPEYLHEYYIDMGSAVRPVYVRFHQGSRWYHRLKAQAGVLSYVGGADETLSGMRAATLFLNSSDTVHLADYGNALKVTTPYGYGYMGPQNSGYCHFGTDRAAFYFAQEVQFGNNARAYNTQVMMTGSGFYANYNSGYLLREIQGTYGTISISGSKNSYAGIRFDSGYLAPNLMFQTGATAGGIYDETNGWWLQFNGTQWETFGKAIPHGTWGNRCVMSRGTAAPSGGSDGDVYLQYT